MNKLTLGAILAILALALSGCSSSPKTPKGSSTAGTDSISASTKKLEQDFSQTQTDFGKFESEVKLSQ